MPWFLRPAGTVGSPDPVLVPEWMPDTLQRLRREGWAEIPDPRPQVRPEVGQDEQPDHIRHMSNMIDADPEQTKALLAEQRIEQVKAVKARNTSARKWVERKG